MFLHRRRGLLQQFFGDRQAAYFVWFEVHDGVVLCGLERFDQSPNAGNSFAVPESENLKWVY
jgi:hypothetical protein